MTLGRPHHDPSPLYVSNLHPELGETVTLRLRVPAGYSLSRVFLRFLCDGEGTSLEASLVSTASTGETWWSIEVPMVNDTLQYRWYVFGPRHPRGAWVNGTGLHARDVPDRADFRITTSRPPAWVDDAVVYQIFPDRFARSAAADGRQPPDWAEPASWDTPVAGRGRRAGRQFYGGDLDGIREHLDHIVALGATAIYLTPVFPAGSNHRYDATTFDAVDPLLGGDEALRRLVAAAHERGLRVLGDITTNHTGIGHDWFRRAQADPDSEERGFYFFDGDRYAAWLDVPALPKLNYDSKELGRRLFDDPHGPVRRWLSGPDGLDGWRVDVANMTGRLGEQDRYAEVAKAMRAAATAARADAFLVAEHCHDTSRDALGDGWHGVMNYAGFTRPLWTWLRHPGHAPDFLGLPVVVPRLGGRAVMETMREFGAHLPWATRTHSFNLAGSHDTTRVRSLVGEDAGQVDVAAGLVLTMPGIPMITYGDEIGMLGAFGEDGRRPMSWGRDGRPPAWDERIHTVYRSLIAARRSSPALSAGGLRWVYADDDVLVYLREHPEQTALVHLARLGHDVIRLPLGALEGAAAAQAAYGDPLEIDRDEVVLRADRPTVEVWTWPTNP